MKYWDSSAVAPLLLHEASSSMVRHLYRGDPEMVVWWGTTLECVSAISRHERNRDVTSADATRSLAELDALAAEWHEVSPGEQVRSTARRLLRTHALGAADALQLAAALVVAEGQAAARTIVTLDARLADAARREGFAVEPASV